MSVEVFFSYSHRDEGLRNELEVHLSTLKRQGLISTWHDRCIISGDEFEGKIDQHLNSADIILLLVSPYFIDSNYCYDIEMSRALERHESGEARVIPIILQSCDWINTPLSKLLALPRDGKPVSKYTDHHDAFHEITLGIRDAIKQLGKTETDPTMLKPLHAGSVEENISTNVRSSNLRIRKDYTEQDRDLFLEETFEYIAKYFEGSLSELEKRNPEIKTKYRKIDANTFTAVIYLNGESVSQCQISLGVFISHKQISYSHDISRGANSFNDALSVEDDGHILFLKSGFAFNDSGTHQLTKQGASEYFWSILLRPLQ
ncbi:MAG: toll/interleukin-1 receptor domain-containing protein [Gimesia chilikensis]|uniref:toll/interleukin-1 receptor domain-containing protein n=1 Tax=Gimesia chilikensis TaxID=2605989 RepID=UPI003791DD7C